MWLRSVIGVDYLARGLGICGTPDICRPDIMTGARCFRQNLRNCGWLALVNRHWARGRNICRRHINASFFSHFCDNSMIQFLLNRMDWRGIQCPQNFLHHFPLVDALCRLAPSARLPVEAQGRVHRYVIQTLRIHLARFLDNCRQLREVFSLHLHAGCFCSLANEFLQVVLEFSNLMAPQLHFLSELFFHVWGQVFNESMHLSLSFMQPLHRRIGKC